MFQPRLILHPTDFSDYSHYAYCVALDLARQHGGKVLVLHVVETLGPENVSYGEAAGELEPEAYRQRLWDDLRREVPAPQGGVPVEHFLAEGDPAQQIERLARGRQCDLIVMGTHGRTGLLHRLMGSVTEKVIHLAPCPVLITKLPLTATTSPAT